ncbi:MAG TPA: hypothetical protein DCG75_10485 [Bacteroidales bacterium]|jgi:hypothetical protein|nr:hypothetical protein [Bacteroidales bacterium]
MKPGTKPGFFLIFFEKPKVDYMKILIITILTSVCLLACKSKREISLINDNQIIDEQYSDSIPVENEDETIIIKEENLISIEDSEPILPDEKFFVIIGSFRILNNAISFNNQLQTEGFDSQILQNENGLYRVSIFAFKEINEARNKVYFIRKNYPKYYDVWLLKKLT